MNCPRKDMKLLSWLLIVIIPYILFSCKEEIPLELNEDENIRIVVEGRITDELKSHKIRLTKSASYFSNERVPPLLDADVYIIEENSETRYDLTLVNDSMGFYETIEFSGTIGETYSLNINHEGESYIATAYLDTVPEIVINFHLPAASTILSNISDKPLVANLAAVKEPSTERDP